MMNFPPLHPLFVNFTAALIPTAFAADLLGAWLNREGLRATGWWTVLLAAIFSPFTALFGWVWYWNGMSGQGNLILIHQWLGTSIAAVIVGLAIWRGWRFFRGGNRPGWGYGIAAALLLGGLMVQGDVGGAMSFGQGIVVSGGSHQHGGGGHSHGGGHGGGGEGAPHHGEGEPGHGGASEAGHPHGGAESGHGGEGEAGHHHEGRGSGRGGSDEAGHHHEEGEPGHGGGSEAGHHDEEEGGASAS